MNPQVIGISGSPVKNSNTDRLVQAVLDATGLRTEFVKLSALNIRPCIACLGCTGDNVCKVRDDFPELARKIQGAKALVVGTYPPYGSMDGFTKAFLERMFSMRHQQGLNRGKLAVVAATGISPEVPGLKAAAEQVAHALSMEGIEVLGQLLASGNVECLVCGHGETCPMSALPWIFGDNPRVSADKFQRVEDQTPLWQQAQDLGRELSRRLTQQYGM